MNKRNKKKRRKRKGKQEKKVNAVVITQNDVEDEADDQPEVDNSIPVEERTVPLTSEIKRSFKFTGEWTNYPSTHGELQAVIDEATEKKQAYTDESLKEQGPVIQEYTAKMNALYGEGNWKIEEEEEEEQREGDNGRYEEDPIIEEDEFSLSGDSCSEVDDWSSEAVPFDSTSSPGTHETRSGVTTCLQEARAQARGRVNSSTSYRVRHSRYCGCSSGSTDEVTMVEAKVIYATSHDPNYPPGAMMDGRHDTFWATGGMFPQVFVVTLPNVTSVESVTFTAYNIRKVKLSRSIKTQPTDFEDVLEKELNHAEGKLQSTVLSPEQISAAHLRFTIMEGHDQFCSVHRFSVTGSQNAPPANPTAALLLSTKEEASPPPSRLSSQSPEESEPTQKPRAPVQVMPKEGPVTVVSSLFEEEGDKFIAEDISEDDIQEF
ncbi:uncharacterized protein LOC119568130 [Penaeus monodon]|uniref:uncharacterized protein LOC119568130 n=1 Tax=Penaeus monodon TaxID=6687 RepID=UPI0018A7DFF6|nr:uncharacterized protein LOC119568130 [Penaeus monodon]